MRVQTFTDFELLLIDDGSTDGSHKLCDEFAAKDRRIKVWHKQNEGVSATRQFGIEHCEGTYIIQWDADDWVDEKMLELMFHEIQRLDADMVICDIEEHYREHSNIIRQRPSGLVGRKVLEDVLRHNIRSSLWNKLIKASLYKKHARFPSGINYAEDELVLIDLLCHTSKVGYVSHVYYHYNRFENPLSITKRADKRLMEWRWGSAVEFSKKNLPFPFFIKWQ